MMDRSQLVASVLPLAHWIVNRWSKHHPELRDEFTQEAGLAVLIAAVKYDPARHNASWPGFAAQSVRWALSRYLQKLAERRRRFPEARPVVDDDGEKTNAVEYVGGDPDPTQDPARAAVAARARAAVAALPPRQRQVVKARYLEVPGRTLEAVGGELGVTRERVRQIEVGAFEKLRTMLGGERVT